MPSACMRVIDYQSGRGPRRELRPQQEATLGFRMPTDLSALETRRALEVSDPYANVMLNPAAAGPGVCRTCWSFHDPAYGRCCRRGRQPANADVVVPVTYSIDREQMHYALRRYKDGATPDIRGRFQR